MTGSAAYAKHLYSNDLDGYLQLARIDSNSGKLSGRYFTRATAQDSINAAKGAVDVYTTPNSFYIPERASANIRHFRSLYVDLDLDQYEKSETVYQVFLMAEAGTIPQPTMAVDSGRGVHLYWRIEHAPMAAAWTWQELQDYLYKKLKHLGADPKATDGARLLRLPGTINSKNGNLCKILHHTNKTYSMYELREQYLNVKPKPDKQPKAKKNGQVKHLFNPYSLHQARLSDLLTLCHLRDYDMEGYRNTTLLLFSYWQGVITRDCSELERTTLDFNRKFKEPLSDSEVKAIARCVPKAIEAFLNDEVTPLGKAGYNYKNTTLIERLDITEREQRELKTIISSKEKNRRKDDRRKEARRNDEGRTEREQRKANLTQKVRELNVKGLKQTEIAEELGLTQQYISKLLKTRT